MSFPATSVTKNMATVTLSNPNNSPAWGASYWQYFEDLDKIKNFQATPLQLEKQLFKTAIANGKEVLTPVTNDNLKVGDLIKVRIVITVDRAMEYVHLKDHRASGFEPTNVISQYKWQDGLGYYETTKDAASHFFIDYLPKGTFVFEYPVRVQHRGSFSNGITTIQCMYAPEYTSHSEGIKVSVK